MGNKIPFNCGEISFECPLDRTEVSHQQYPAVEDDRVMGNKCPVPSGYVCDTGMKSKEAAEAETHTDMGKKNIWPGKWKLTWCPLGCSTKEHNLPQSWIEALHISSPMESTDRGAKAGTQWKYRNTGWRAAPLAQGDAGDTCLPHEGSVQAAERSPAPGMLCPCRQTLLCLEDILSSHCNQLLPWLSEGIVLEVNLFHKSEQ